LIKLIEPENRRKEEKMEDRVKLRKGKNDENGRYYTVKKVICDRCKKVIKDGDMENYYWNINGFSPMNKKLSKDVTFPVSTDTGIRSNISIDLCENCFWHGLYGFLNENNINRFA
jgi:hypothetical protein